MDSQGRRDDEPLCTGAGGHRLEDTATRRFFRLMFPEVRAHFESPRQEEHRSTPAGMRPVALIQRRRSHPLAARSVGLSRAPAPSSMSRRTGLTRPRKISQAGGMSSGAVAVDWVAG